jgi:hypothetical protein
VGWPHADTKKESQPRDRHAGGYGVGWPQTNCKRNTSEKNVLLVYAEGATQRKVTFTPTENKDFSNVIHCSRNVIRCERRSSQCTSTSQFGDPKIEKRKNKRKPRSRCVRELKSARSILYGGGIARASRFREKHVPQEKREEKRKGLAVYAHKPGELKNVARLTDGQQALSDETKLILRREPSSDYHSFHLRNEAIITFRTNFTARQMPES